MVTVRQVDNPIDSTFEVGFIVDCDATALLGENVEIFFLKKCCVCLLALKISKKKRKCFCTPASFILMFMEGNYAQNFFFPKTHYLISEEKKFFTLPTGQTVVARLTAIRSSGMALV